MGKYTKYEPDEDHPEHIHSDQVKRDLVQIGIANELAEMNRLKRIQLTHRNSVVEDMVEDQT